MLRKTLPFVALHCKSIQLQQLLCQVVAKSCATVLPRLPLNIERENRMNNEHDAENNHAHIILKALLEKNPKGKLIAQSGDKKHDPLADKELRQIFGHSNPKKGITKYV